MKVAYYGMMIIVSATCLLWERRMGLKKIFKPVEWVIMAVCAVITGIYFYLGIKKPTAGPAKRKRKK